MPVRQSPAASLARPASIWIERLVLTDFRNFTSATVIPDPRPVVLVGANGAGKTNLLEAVSLLASGQGLRRAPYAELARRGGAGGWAVAARMHTARGIVDIGTGMLTGRTDSDPAGRIVRVDGATQPGSGVLADYVEMVWLTPAMDGLFTGPASERRRFLDRMILCFDPAHRTRAGHFERAMRQRNRLLAEGVRGNARFEGLEIVMAETGVALAAARGEAVAALAATIAGRQARDPRSPFPSSRIRLEGWLDQQLTEGAAVDVEEAYFRALIAGRERDRVAGRTLDGPHRSDLIVEHGAKAMPAKACSSGEQKGLLIGLVLVHAELVAQRRRGIAPILLLDEIAAHLDGVRRAALCAEILHLSTQAWMTGTDRQDFAGLEGEALFLGVDDGCIRPLS
ncbi:MAG TPA: DNA replication/repair protein RecF [Hyphomicrobiaceae bacterium]|jgi:DNA replication and repair protein RecF|nr:DNA replication/repair protein RecF [Hyphomicrobiaceae bacterium]